MDKFSRLTGVAAPLMRANIDTDAIIPSREIIAVSKSGLGEALFAGWRYQDETSRAANPDFVLNHDQYQDAKILLAGENFGCGSSREHAVWALRDWGFRVIIAPSFGSIFQASCTRNGLLPIVLAEETIAFMAGSNPLIVDLEDQVVLAPDGSAHSFEISAEQKLMLLEGLDHIDLTLSHKDEILAFRANDRKNRPWAYL